jgi:hypothetical protein
LRVEVGLTAEPRLRPLFLQYAAADQKAIDRSGAVLAPFSPSANIEAPLGDGRKQSRLQLDFDLPQAEIGPTVDLRGKLRLMTAAGSAAIRFGNLDKLAREKSLAIARRRGGVTVTLERVELERVPDDRQQARVRISVTYDSGGPAFESHRTWILHNEVYLETPGGERIALNGGVEMTLQADGAVGLEYTFARLPRDLAGYAFVYIVPTLIVDVPIEYEIQSVRVAGE